MNIDEDCTTVIGEEMPLFLIVKYNKDTYILNDESNGYILIQLLYNKCLHAFLYQGWPGCLISRK